MKRFSFYIIGAFIILSLSTGIYLKQPVNIAQAQPPPDIEDFFDDLTEEFDTVDKEELRRTNKEETQEAVAVDILASGVPCGGGPPICQSVSFSITEGVSPTAGAITVTFGGFTLVSGLDNTTQGPVVDAPAGSIQPLVITCLVNACDYQIFVTFGVFTPGGGSSIGPTVMALNQVDSFNIQVD